MIKVNLIESKSPSKWVSGYAYKEVSWIVLTKVRRPTRTHVGGTIPQLPSWILDGTGKERALFSVS